MLYVVLLWIKFHGLQYCGQCISCHPSSQFMSCISHLKRKEFKQMYFLSLQTHWSHNKPWVTLWGYVVCCTVMNTNSMVYNIVPHASDVIPSWFMFCHYKKKEFKLRFSFHCWIIGHTIILIEYLVCVVLL